MLEKLAISIIKEFPGHSFGWQELSSVLGQVGCKPEVFNVQHSFFE